MKDILIDTDNKLQFANGDFVVGESDDQQKKLLLQSDKGSWKEWADRGVGIIKFVESNSPADMLKEINTQFTSDGMTINKIGFENGKLIIDAPYK